MRFAPIDRSALNGAGYTPIVDANNGETASGLAFVRAWKFLLPTDGRPTARGEGVRTRAMQVDAAQAKDTELIDYATEAIRPLNQTRVRARWKLGRLLGNADLHF